LRSRRAAASRGSITLGIQVENKSELHEVYARLRKAGGTIIEQGETACCYAKSEKSWIDDPAGIAWETFHTTGESTDYGDGTGENDARLAHSKAQAATAQAANAQAAGACCVPQATVAAESASACCK
jgi:predicted 3-demethylubiquinone-9 3-methyltransferase (glyoxalase superfamily)